MDRQQSPMSSQMSVEVLMSGIPIDERRSPTVQARGAIKASGNFGGVEWVLRVAPVQALGVLLKHWRDWSEATRLQLKAAAGGHRIGPQHAVVVKFLRRKLNLIYRFLMQREAHDDLAVLLDPFRPRPTDLPAQKERYLKLQWAAN